MSTRNSKKMKRSIRPSIPNHPSKFCNYSATISSQGSNIRDFSLRRLLQSTNRIRFNEAYKLKVRHLMSEPLKPCANSSINLEHQVYPISPSHKNSPPPQTKQGIISCLEIELCQRRQTPNPPQTPNPHQMRCQYRTVRADLYSVPDEVDCAS